MTGEAARSPAARAFSRRRFWVANVAVLLALATLLLLGTWQVERLAWKQGVIDTIEARVGAAPVDIPEIERLHRETGDVDYVPARARGVFLHEGERHFLSTFRGEAGWNLYVPLVLEGSGDVLFVNRGFVPYARRDPETRREGQVAGAVEVVGLARDAPAEKSGSFLPDNDPAANTFFWRSIPDMGKGLALPAGAKLLPFFLDAGPSEAPGGLPVGGTTVIEVPNNHLQYAITWYGLALSLAVMYGAFLLRRRRAAPDAP